MKRVAFATELGGGLGHVSRLAPWRAHVGSRGVATLGLLPDLRVVADAPGIVGAPYAQAPRLAHGPLLKDFDPASYAEVLIGAGYGNAAVLGALADAWRHVFDLAGVAGVVVDHAPTAILAARLAGLPILHIGDGFTLPPAGRSEAPYDPAAGRRDPERFARAARLALSCINAVLGARGAGSLDSLDDLLEPASQVIVSYPELDHRQAGRDPTRYSGHFAVPDPEDEGWQAVGGPRVFAYLKPGTPGFEAVLALLGRFAGQVRVHAQGLVRSEAPGPALWQWSAAPLPTSAIADCDLVVCHAGHGTVCEALLAGKPLFMLPHVFEQMMTARNVAALGAGTWFHPAQEQAALRRSLRQVLEDGKYRAAAQGFAARYARGRGERAARLAERADRFLALVGMAGAR
jgi:UDP:flavonoid glycosyltransferase YjiC (YdhE family)